MEYRPHIIDNTITNERINSYKRVFPNHSDADLVASYLWNLNACSEIYSLLAIAEVSFRNAIDRELTEFIGPFWWSAQKLHYKSYSGNNHQKPEVVKRLKGNFSKAFSNAKREKEERYHIYSSPTHAEVISKTDFSTWELILNDEYNGNNLIWPSKIGKVFRGSWGNTRTPGTILSTTRDIVKDIREFRNRVFHHEPAWKVFHVRNEVDAVNYLNKKVDKIAFLIGLVSPEKLRLIERNGILKDVRKACSIDNLNRLQKKSLFKCTHESKCIVCPRDHSKINKFNRYRFHYIA